VYIEEKSSGARPIEAVGTSTAAFVGVAPNADASLNLAVPINNWTEFLKRYTSTATTTGTPLAQAVYGFFLNGGRTCYVVNVGKDGSGKSNAIVGDAKQRRGLDVLTVVDEVAIVAAPGYTDPRDWEQLLTHCENLKDRIAILDAPETVDVVEALAVAATPREAGDKKKASAGIDADGPAGLRPRESPLGYGAFYFPWIKVADPFNPTASLISVPPSGHIAGIYARTDATRGVHKAPANEGIRGALDLTYRVTREDQEKLNPKGVNCIRFFTTEGIKVWGARTLAASASDWRYINVRRLFNMIEESIIASTRWVVFEPNDPSLWKSIRRDVSAFLTLIWRQGALFGATPDQAFFVKCDEETNPQEDIDAGRVNILIGIAPVKPAEFVVFQIGQTAAGAEVTNAGAAVKEK
jgi:phage tail sheath protein FI